MVSVPRLFFLFFLFFLFYGNAGGSLLWLLWVPITNTTKWITIWCYLYWIKNKKIIVSHNQTIPDNLEFPISVNSTTPFDLNSTYNVNKKHSVQSKTFSEWQVWSNSQTTEEFLFKSNYILEPDCLYKIKPIEEELIESYNTIRKIILSQSHKSIFSKNKEDFNKCIDEMISSCEKNNNWGKLKDFFNVQANERANFESFAIGKSK